MRDPWDNAHRGARAMKVYQAIAEVLRREQIKIVFSVIGDGNMRFVIDFGSFLSSTRLVAMAIPQITAAMCSQIVRRQRSARKPPIIT